MKKQNDKLKWMGWGIITLIPVWLAVVLLWNLFLLRPEPPCRWLLVAHWAITALLVLLAAWMVYYSYSKLLKMLNKQQLEQKKLKQEKELDEGHNKFRTVTGNNEYLLRKEAAGDELLLKLVDKLSDRKEVVNEATKTITLSFRKELLDEVKAIKVKWDEMK